MFVLCSIYCTPRFQKPSLQWLMQKSRGIHLLVICMRIGDMIRMLNAECTVCVCVCVYILFCRFGSGSGTDLDWYLLSISVSISVSGSVSIWVYLLAIQHSTAPFKVHICGTITHPPKISLEGKKAKEWVSEHRQHSMCEVWSPICHVRYIENEICPSIYR